MQFGAFMLLALMYAVACFVGYRLYLRHAGASGGSRRKSGNGGHGAVTRVIRAFSGRIKSWAGDSSRSAGHAGRTIGASIWADRWKFLAITLVMAVPILVILGLQDRRLLESLPEDKAHDNNPVVMALLRGEQLVPPPPLPPAVFSTPDVLKWRPAIDTADRDWALLDADFRVRLLVLFEEMAQKGYQLVLLEGYRSPERQEMLARMGGHVTNARAYQSYHQYGLAADVAFMRKGKIVITEKDPWAMEGYRLYGEEAEKLGLVWGGRWKMADLGHIEYRKPGVKRGVPPDTERLANR